MKFFPLSENWEPNPGRSSETAPKSLPAFPGQVTLATVKIRQPTLNKQVRTRHCTAAEAKDRLASHPQANNGCESRLRLHAAVAHIPVHLTLKDQQMNISDAAPLGIHHQLICVDCVPNPT